MSADRTRLALAAREAVDRAVEQVRLHEWSAGADGVVETEESRAAVERLRQRLTALYRLATLADDEVEATAIVADLARQDRHYRTHPRTEATS